jgi:hypothetical protein
MPDEFIYRVTRRRPNPQYYQSKVKTQLCSTRSLAAILKSVKQATDHFERHRDQYSLTEPSESIIKIERGRIMEFEDVTSEYVPAVQPDGSDSLRVEEQVP